MNTLSGWASPSEASEWTATGHEPPVFLDERGRRRRWVAAGGALSATGAALWLGALVAGTVGFNALPSLHPQPPTARAISIVAGYHHAGMIHMARLNRGATFRRVHAAVAGEERAGATQTIKVSVAHRHRLVGLRTLALADVF